MGYAVAMSQLETRSGGGEVEAARRNFYLLAQSSGSIDAWPGESGRLGNTQYPWKLLARTYVSPLLTALIASGRLDASLSFVMKPVIPARRLSRM